MLLSQAVAAYVEGRRARGEIGAGSARQFAWRLSGLVACHPGLDISELSRSHILDWQATVGGQRPASRRGYLSTVKGFCAWAVDEGLLAVDPAARVAKVREPRGEPRGLSGGQVNRLLMVLPDDRARLIVALMWRCGLRCVEVARLQVGDWDPVAAKLRVVGKGGHVRTVPAKDELLPLLNAAAATGSGPLVGLGAAAVSRLVSAWMTQAGIKARAYDGVSAHALRHTAATNMLDRCHNVRTVQKILGHLNVATTDRYLGHVGLEEMRAAI